MSIVSLDYWPLEGKNLSNHYNTYLMLSLEYGYCLDMKFLWPFLDSYSRSAVITLLIWQ